MVAVSGCSYIRPLSPDNYIEVDPTPVDVEHAAHAGHCIVRLLHDDQL